MEASDKTNVDEIYYRDGMKHSMAMRILVAARRSMFELFMKELAPGPATTVVDIGVSDDENEGANYLEKHYPWPRSITCAGIGDGELVRRAYPDISFVRIEPGQSLPFENDRFDIACSNAVIEHVGGAAQRQAFIAEHLRIAKTAFITFPNRWFPIEHHTGIPILHYIPSLFRKALKGTKYSYWADPEQMDFLDARTVLREWPPGLPQPTRIVTTGLPLGPLSSNIAVICKRD